MLLDCLPFLWLCVSLFRACARALSLSLLHTRTHTHTRTLRFTYTHTHTRAHTYTHTHAYTNSHIRALTFSHALAHTPTHPLKHLYTLSLSHTHTHNCVCVVVHVDVCIHVYPCRSVRACARVCVRTMKDTQILVFKIFGWYLHIYVAFRLYVYNRSPLLYLTLLQKSAIWYLCVTTLHFLYACVWSCIWVQVRASARMWYGVHCTHTFGNEVLVYTEVVQSSIEIGWWRDVSGTLFLSPPPPLRFLDLSRFLPFLALSVCNSAYLFLFCYYYGSQARACVLVFCLRGPRTLSSCISCALIYCISTVHRHTQWFLFVVTQDIIIITGDIIMITVIIIITKTLCQEDPFVSFLYLWFWYHLHFIEILKELPFKYLLFWKINTWNISPKKTGNILSCSLLMYPPQKKLADAKCTPRPATRGTVLRAVKVLTSH